MMSWAQKERIAKGVAYMPDKVKTEKKLVEWSSD